MKSAISDFKVWAARMGFGQREVTKAAESVGIDSRNTASLTYNGKRELTLSERLAMSAVRAGLKPWTPAYDSELQRAQPAPHQASAD